MNSRKFTRSISTTIKNSIEQKVINEIKTTTIKKPIIWTHLTEKLPYNLGLLLQETLVHNRLQARTILTTSTPSTLASFSSSKLNSLKRTAENDILLLLQHTPVYTAGRREKDLNQTKLEGERLRKLGADYVVTMRGGQTTYHGPGQLVGYSIMDTANADLTTRCYVDKMETFLSKLTTNLSVPVYPLEHTGVFTSPTSKIGSIGIHIRHRITLHGFSLNIKEETLNWFDNIIACGLDDVKATSVVAELKRLGLDLNGVVEVEDVIEKAVKGFGESYNREMVELGKGEEFDELRKVIEDGVAGLLPPLP